MEGYAFEKSIRDCRFVVYITEEVHEFPPKVTFQFS